MQNTPVYYRFKVLVNFFFLSPELVRRVTVNHLHNQLL